MDIQSALKSMLEEAGKLGVSRGVAAILYVDIHKPHRTVEFAIHNTFQRSATQEKDTIEKPDTGTNYFGVAMGKLAYMLSEHVDSGFFIRPIKTGESPYRGGLFRRIDSNHLLFIAFSGGTEEQDVIIAEKAMELLFPEDE